MDFLQEWVAHSKQVGGKATPQDDVRTPSNTPSRKVRGRGPIHPWALFFPCLRIGAAPHPREHSCQTRHTGWAQALRSGPTVISGWMNPNGKAPASAGGQPPGRVQAVHPRTDPSDVQDDQKIGFAFEGLRGLRAAVCLEKEMGEGVGRGEVLLGRVSDAPPDRHASPDRLRPRINPATGS